MDGDEERLRRRRYKGWMNESDNADVPRTTRWRNLKRTRNDDEERDVECHENHDGAVNGDCPVRNASVTFHDEEILEVGNRSDSSNGNRSDSLRFRLGRREC